MEPPTTPPAIAPLLTEEEEETGITAVVGSDEDKEVVEEVEEVEEVERQLVSEDSETKKARLRAVYSREGMLAVAM
jgi:hypothetical protein